MPDNDVRIKMPCECCAGRPGGAAGCTACAGTGWREEAAGLHLPSYLSGAGDPYELQARLGLAADNAAHLAELARGQGNAWYAGYNDGRRVGLLAARFALDFVLREAARRVGRG